MIHVSVYSVFKAYTPNHLFAECRREPLSNSQIKLLFLISLKSFLVVFDYGLY